MKKENLGRNELCHCGSGIKYKRCCLNGDFEENYRSTLEQSLELFMQAMIEDLEDEVGLRAFHEFFPDVAEKESRVLWANGRDPETREPYQIIEYFCADPKCDCNRVVLALADREKMDEGTILSVGFAFDRNDPDPGPYIDPLNPATREGQSLYPHIEKMLRADFDYIARLKRHYVMMKQKTEARGKQFLEPSLSP